MNYLDAAYGQNPRNKRVKLKILILFSSELQISRRTELLFQDSQPLLSCPYDKGNKNMNMNIQHFWNDTDRVDLSSWKEHSSSASLPSKIPSRTGARAETGAAAV